MIDPFEAALADLLADGTASHAAVETVARPSDGLGSLDAGAARVLVAVADGHTTEMVGGDRPERLDATRQRATLRLSGLVRISVEVAAASGAPAASQREVLWRAADAVLVILSDPEVTSGRAWGDAHEQGFAIDRLHLATVGEPQPPALPDHRRLAIVCHYEGRFWPVTEVAEGGVIVAPIRTRIAVGDPQIPDGLQAVSGGGDVVAPVRVDLRAAGLAEPRLVTRLLGAAPPGHLVGDSDGVPAGAIGYLPDADGAFPVRFRPAPPPASGSATILLSLAGEDAPTVTLGRLHIEVTRP